MASNVFNWIPEAGRGDASSLLILRSHLPLSWMRSKLPASHVFCPFGQRKTARADSPLAVNPLTPAGVCCGRLTQPTDSFRENGEGPLVLQDCFLTRHTRRLWCLRVDFQANPQHKESEHRMGARVSSERAAIAERKQLIELEKSEGTEFPGSDFHSDNHKEWMSTLDLGNIKVKDVLWPGTHDSATDKIGIYGISRPYAQCQRISIYNQLVQGVRMFDIRVENTGKVCHGILKSYKVDIVINDLKRFLAETTKEIVILEIRTEFGYEDPPQFDKWLTEQLSDYLVTQDANIFDKTLQEVLPKRVICIWRPRKDPAPAPGSSLFSSAFLKDNWTDTDLPLTKFNANLKHLAEHPSNNERKYFYRVENTCTPQITSAILCVYPVTNRIRIFARLFISQAYKKGLGDHLQIVSSDFVNAAFIDACIGVTIARQTK